MCMHNTKQIAAKLVVLGCIVSLLSACYPMPAEGEYSAIPTTNNPDVVGSHNSGLLPGGGF